jgi:hypothetical protein
VKATATLVWRVTLSHEFPRIAEITARMDDQEDLILSYAPRVIGSPDLTVIRGDQIVLLGIANTKSQ